MRNCISIMVLLMFMATYGQQTDTISEYYLQPVEVQQDDNLWKLAEEHYKDGRQYSKFWTVSKTKGLTNNPDSIYPGMVLYKLAKKNKLPSYHELKFDTIYALLDEQKNSIDTITSHLNNINVDIKNFPCCVGTNDDFDSIWAHFMSFIIGVASSLFATMVSRKIWPEKPSTQILFMVLFPLLAFLTTMSVFSVSWNAPGFIGIIIRLILTLAVLILLTIAVITLYKKLKAAQKQQKQPKIPNIYLVVDKFYESIFDWTQKDKELRGDWPERDRLDYWIGYWKIFGEYRLSNLLKELKQWNDIKQDGRELEQIMERIVKHLKTVLERHKN